MVRPLGIVPSGPSLKVLPKLLWVSDGGIQVVVDELILEDAVEALDMGVHQRCSGRTPEMGEVELSNYHIKQGMEFTAIIGVDGVDGKGELRNNRQEKDFGMEATGCWHQSYPSLPGLEFQSGEKDQLLPQPIHSNPIQLQVTELNCLRVRSSPDGIATPGMLPFPAYWPSPLKEELVAGDQFANPGNGVDLFSPLPAPFVKKDLELVLGQMGVLLPHGSEE